MCRSVCGKQLQVSTGSEQGGEQEANTAAKRVQGGTVGHTRAGTWQRSQQRRSTKVLTQRSGAALGNVTHQAAQGQQGLHVEEAGDNGQSESGNWSGGGGGSGSGCGQE